MPVDPETEHRPTELDVVLERRPDDVLDDPRSPRHEQEIARRTEQVGVLDVLVARTSDAVVLARRAGVDRVELVSVLGQVRERIALDEHVAGVADLGSNIDPSNVKPC
jgi:hypothetical protein